MTISTGAFDSFGIPQGLHGTLDDLSDVDAAEVQEGDSIIRKNGRWVPGGGNEVTIQNDEPIDGTELWLDLDDDTGTGGSDSLTPEEADARYVNIAGDVMTGTLGVSAPTLGGHAVNRDSADARYLQLTGGTLTGGVTVSPANTSTSVGLQINSGGGVVCHYPSNAVASMGAVAVGGQYGMRFTQGWYAGSGALAPLQIGAPFDGNSAATVNWVDGSYLNLAGGTITGSLTVNGTLTAAGTSNMGIGLSYPGFTNGGPYGANRIGMAWKSPNIVGGVDNANNAVLGVVSSREFKTGIVPLARQTATDLLMRLRPNSYEALDWVPGDRSRKYNTGRRHYGLVADEVAHSIPSAVLRDDAGKPMSVNYTELVPLLVSAVQDLSARVAELEVKLAAQVA